MPRSIHDRRDDNELSATSTGRAGANRTDVADRAAIRVTIDTRTYDPVLRELGSRIRLIRHQLHLSQQECAARCHIDRAHMSRLERGFPNTSVLHLAKLAHGLGIEIADLFKA
jgi:DNA-binding XRE family transcriptional regulator